MISGYFTKWMLILSLVLACEIAISSRCVRKVLERVKSEDVKISFVTRLRSKREIHANDFHILEVNRPAHNSSFHIHLVKNDNLSTPSLKVVHDDNVTAYIATTTTTLANEEDCFYTGVISSQSFQGRSALSACGKNPGFQGVLMLDSEMYILEPKKSAIGAEQENTGIVHSLTPMSADATSDLIKCGKHGIYAPPAQPYSDGEFEVKGPVPLSATRNVNFRGKQLNQKRISYSFSSNYKSPGSSSTFSDITEERVVELAIYADKTFMDNIKKKLDTTSTKIIRAFICILVETMSMLYEDPILKAKIKFKIVHLELFSKTPSAINDNHGLLKPYLTSFCKYATDHSTTGYDHAMLLTNIDLRDENSNGAVGVAFTNGCCMEYAACSIIEVSSFQAAYIMAHEVGHSLGMDHDAETKNKDCKTGEHIMSAIVGPKQTKWSTCSSRNLQEFIKRNENTLYRNIRKGCLKSLTATTAKSYTFKTSKLPGERFTPDQQCLLYDSKRPKSINTKELLTRFGLKDDICAQLFCTDKNVMYAMFAHPALEGTECGTGKQCQKGACKTKF